MTNNERIEAYFNNGLSEAERQQLLQDIEADATLKSEFQFQQEVIDGIKAYRKQQLIARLDNVKVTSAGKPVWVKAVGITGMVAVATLGTWLWLDKPSEQPAEQLKNNEVEQLTTTGNEAVTPTPTTPDKIVPVAEDKEEQQAATTKEKEATAKPVKEKATGQAPQIIVPEISEPETETPATTDVDISAPEAMSSSAVRLSTSTDVEVKVSKKYRFHYQVKDGGLTLYGNFNDSPFEVLEMKTSKGIKSYLYYKEHFYALETDSDKIRPLIAIENQQLIEELQKRR